MTNAHLLNVGLSQGTKRKSVGRPHVDVKSVRVHITVPQSLADRMTEIQLETHAPSLTSVVKDALTLYAAALKEHQSGGKVYFKREGETTDRELAIFL